MKSVQVTESRLNLRLGSKVRHWPTLKTVLMIEKAIESADSPISLEELKRRLQTKVMDQTLRLILAYLEDKGTIYVGPKGISWVENNNAKFLKFISKNKVLKL